VRAVVAELDGGTHGEYPARGCPAYGCADHPTLPVEIGRLRSVHANAARARELKGGIHALRTPLRQVGRFGPLLGTSPGMQKVHDLMARVVPNDATVLIVGESGTTR